jgi:hypothetical protein
MIPIFLVVGIVVTVYALLNSVVFLRLVNGKLKLRYSELMVVVTGCDSGFGLMLSLALTKIGFFVVSVVLTQEGILNIIFCNLIFMIIY